MGPTPESAVRPAPAPSPSAPVSPVERRREKLLVVDDEKGVLDVFLDFFGEEGYEVHAAADGAQALDRIREEEYDLILTDINLPGASGLEVVRAAKRRNAETGVLVITGHASLSTAIEAMHCGANDFIMKPFDLLAVSQVAERTLRGKRLAEENRRLVACLTLANEKLQASEESLQARVDAATRTLRTLFEMSREVSASLSLSTTLAVVTEKCRELLEARACAAFLRDEDTGNFLGEGVAGADPAVVKSLVFHPGEGVLGKALADPRGVCAAQGAAEFDADDTLALLRASSVACLPMLASGQPFALLAAVDRDGGFDAQAMELMALYAGAASNAIRNAQLFEKTRELDRLKSEFVAVVSHEVRTPLTAIRGSLELLGNPAYWELRPPQRELLDICQANTDRLMMLINDILDFSKLEANRMALARTQVRLADVCRQAATNIRSLLDKKQIRLTLEMPEPEGESEVDPHRVGQVLTNLLGNAVKFSPPETEIILRLVEDADSAVIEVEDHGEGIADSDLPKLFQRFQQVDASATRKSGGTGLGLVISKAIVELHGGEISVRSQLGQGSTFSVRLPRTAPEGSEASAEEPQERAA
ncbi:MAG TPA: ATP-binding protein [Candidatus Saccharimonadales bacterium]|nr:ATP-binding protein [Candidatus Saccharimonadales bacterium]